MTRFFSGVGLSLLLAASLAAQSALPHIDRNTRGNLDPLRISQPYSVAGGLPSAASYSGKVIVVPDTDGVSCTAAGSTVGWCRSNGSTWVLFGVGGGFAAFSSITGGTNTAAAMVVGSGASLSATGTGAITATAGDSATSFFAAGVLEVVRGGVGADLSATGGAGQVLKQATTGAPITVAQLNFTELAGTLSGAQAAAVRVTDLADVGCTTVAFSATANFDASAASCFVMTLTANLTAPTLTGELPDQKLRWLFKQDAVTGTWVVTYPAEVVGSCTIATGVNQQTLVEAFVDSDGDVTITGCWVKSGPDAWTFAGTSGATIATPPTGAGTIFQDSDTGEFSVKKPGGSVVSLESAADGVGVDQIADEGSNLTKRAVVNFTGSGVSCADNAGSSRTDCTITGGGGGSGTVGSNVKQSFTSQTSVALTHDFGHDRLIVSCYDGSGIELIPATTTIAGSAPYSVTVTFSTAQTGFCVVSGGGSGVYNHTVTASTSETVLATTHQLGTDVTVSSCVDNGTPAAWTLPNSWTRNTSGDIVITFTASFTGVCQLVSGGTDASAKPVSVVLQVFAPTTDTATGDGKQYFPVPSVVNGYTLSAVSAQVVSAGTTGTLNIDLARCDVVATGNACSGTVADMLSTNLTIDSNETRSSTAATPAVIDTANDDVDTDEVIRVDVDAIHTTAAKGLTLTLVFTP